jgi:integrase
MDLSAQIKKVKPNLATSSIKNYIISIQKLHERMFGDKNIENLKFLEDKKKVMETLKDFKDTTKRNYLNSVIVFIQAHNDKYADTDYFKEYTEVRDKLNNDLKTKSTSGEKSEKQEKNWITTEEYDNILNTYKKFFSRNKIFSKDVDKDDLRLLQEFALLKLYQQIPSRNDFATIRILSPREYQKIKGNKLEENLLITDRDKYYFIINSWKTKKDDLDRRRIEVPTDIKKVLKLLISKQKGNYLFTNKNGSPLKRNGLTKYLQAIFRKFYPDKNVSTSMLRHMYLTSKYGDVKEEMKKDAELLAHSGSMQQQYIKEKD